MIEIVLGQDTTPKRQTNDDIENSLGFHPATDDVRAQYEAIRARFIELAQFLNAMPDSREKSLGFTHLEQAQMYYIKAVAVNHTPLVKE